MSRALTPGTKVLRPAEPRVTGVVTKADGRFTTVFWSSGREETVATESLVTADIDRKACSPTEMLLELTYRRLEHPQTDQLLSYRASRTDLLPHQFIPVRKLVASPSQRLLIADEVGTGKTIEAGLIWAELEARSRDGLSSVLVVCPKALVGKWQSELMDRFDLHLEILGSDTWRAALVTAQRDGSLGPRYSHAIVGLELARREDLIGLLGDTDCSWDLVIIDEAHEMRNPETNSHAFALLLADRASALLLLTATPIHTSLDNLRSLFRIMGMEQAADPVLFQEEVEQDSRLNEVAGLVRGLPPGWRDAALRQLEAMRLPFGTRVDIDQLLSLLPPAAPTPAERVTFLSALSEAQAFTPHMTRTLRGDVDVNRAVRHAEVHRIAFNPAQQAFYDLVYQLSLDRAAALGTPPGFVSQMPERRTASCAPAVAEEVLAIAREKEDENELQAALSESECSRLVPFAKAVLAAPDEKAAALTSALRELAEHGYSRAIVFSTFRGTLRYLEAHLRRAGLRVAQIHGDVPPRDEDCRPGQLSRDAIAFAFRNGEYDVLLGSEVIGQGLDFEHCAAVINYDLPWNPMRVEQRIGRVDRIGQRAEKIVIVNFTSRGTIEARILDRLYVRLDVFERTLGAVETILGEALEDFTRDLFSRRLTPQQQEERLDRVARAVQERMRQADIAEKEHGSLLSAAQRIEADKEDLRALEGAFLTPAELQRFVESTLVEFYGLAVTTRTGDGLTRIRLGPLLEDLSRLGRSLPATGHARNQVRRLVSRARTKSEELLGSFEPEYREGVDFLHVRHPLTLLCRHLHRERASRARLGAAILSARPGFPRGTYVAAWAIASYKGLLSRVELIEICTGHDGRPKEDSGRLTALRWLAEAQPDPDAPGSGEFDDLLDDLRRQLAESAERGRATLADRNAQAVERARVAVASAVAGRRRWLQQRLAAKGLDARLRRMFTSWDARLERETAGRLEQLEKLSTLEFSCEFLGAMVFRMSGSEQETPTADGPSRPQPMPPTGRYDA